MRDLNQVDFTFANFVTNNQPRLHIIQNDATQLAIFLKEGLFRAFQHKCLSQEAYGRFQLGIQQKRTAKQLLRYIYDLSLGGAGLNVVQPKQK